MDLREEDFLRLRSDAADARVEHGYDVRLGGARRPVGGGALRRHVLAAGAVISHRLTWPVSHSQVTALGNTETPAARSRPNQGHSEVTGFMVWPMLLHEAP